MTFRELGKMKLGNTRRAARSPRRRGLLPMRLLGLGLAVVAASCISGGPPDLQVAGVHAALQTVSPGELLDRVDYTARACVGQSIHVKVTP